MTAKKLFNITILSLLFLLFTFTQFSLACEFTFNYESIEAPLGTVGDIGIRVYKTHNNCTLQSMDEYKFEKDNIQILEESEWQEIESNVYEKWFKVLLSEKGDGYILIWKECSKEGYQEKKLPIKIKESKEEVQQAISGDYPYKTDNKVSNLNGDIKYEEDKFIIGDLVFELSEFDLAAVNIEAINGYQKPVYVYYDNTDNKKLLLIAGEDLYYRFDYQLDEE